MERFIATTPINTPLVGVPKEADFHYFGVRENVFVGALTVEAANAPTTILQILPAHPLFLPPVELNRS